MSTMFTVNNKQISHKDLNTVRDFFTDDQWDLIDYALSEYQDHEDATSEKCKETLRRYLSTIQIILLGVYNNELLTK